jgi:hypothetical protein
MVAPKRTTSGRCQETGIQMNVKISRAIVEGLTERQRALLNSTLEELVAADLPDVAALVVARVFPPGANASRIVDAAGELDPFVEMMLHELQFATVAPGWTLAMREAHARQAVTDAGF